MYVCRQVSLQIKKQITEMMSFQNSSAETPRNVIITGASRGLGKAMAARFAQNGDRLFLSASNAASLYKTMEELTSQYPAALVKAKPFDLSEKGGAEDLGHWVLEETGKINRVSRIDVLINNAGQFLPGTIVSEETGVLEKLIEINLYGAYRLTRVLLPKMMRDRAGHIFNICSIASASLCQWRFLQHQ